MRRGLAVHGRVDRQDHLGDLASRTATHQRIDVEILRPDAIERRQRAAQHMIARPDRAGPLQRPKIRDVLDHDDRLLVARDIGADRAGIRRIDVAADGAGEDPLGRDRHRAGQRHQKLVLLLDQRQRRAPGRTRPKPRQPRQQLDQAFDLGTGSAAGHFST
jgi:hypothetical protein